MSAVSARLVTLHGVLGGQDDIDVIWMVVREPGLLTAEVDQLLGRLLQMKLAAAGSNVDVVKVSERAGRGGVGAAGTPAAARCVTDE